MVLFLSFKKFAIFKILLDSAFKTCMKSSNITEARKTLALFSNTHITFHSSLLTFWKFDMLTVVSSSLNHKTNSLHFLFITNSIINTTETQRKCVLGLNTHWSTMDKRCVWFFLFKEPNSSMNNFDHKQKTEPITRTDRKSE